MNKVINLILVLTLGLVVGSKSYAQIDDRLEQFDREYIKHIIKISLPYGIALFLSVVYFKIDIILLSILEPTEKADISIALYSLPMKVVEVLMVI